MKHSLKATREKMRQIGLRPNIYNNMKGDVRDAASALLNAMFPETARPLRKPANS